MTRRASSSRRRSAAATRGTEVSIRGDAFYINGGRPGTWKYPDAGRRDSERNTREFVAAMREWRRHSLLAFTINLQGGNPGLWHNSALTEDAACALTTPG